MYTIIKRILKFRTPGSISGRHELTIDVKCDEDRALLRRYFYILYTMGTDIAGRTHLHITQVYAPCVALLRLTAPLSHWRHIYVLVLFCPTFSATYRTVAEQLRTSFITILYETKRHPCTLLAPTPSRSHSPATSHGTYSLIRPSVSG